MAQDKRKKKKLQEWTGKARENGYIKNFYFTYLWYERNDSEKKVHAKISARPTIPETPFSYCLFENDTKK